MTRQSLPNAPAEVQPGNTGLSAAYAGTLWVGGSLKFTGNAYLATGDGNDTTTDADTAVVDADTSSSTLTLTVDSTTTEEGRLLYVFDGGGNAGTNTITVTGGSGVTINGTSNISSNNATTAMVSDGTNWWVL